MKDDQLEQDKIMKEKKGSGSGGGLLFISAVTLCLSVGFGGGVYQSCNVAFSGKDDRAVCYYRSFTNDPMFEVEEDVPPMSEEEFQRQKKQLKEETPTTPTKKETK